MRKAIILFLMHIIIKARSISANLVEIIISKFM